MTRPTLADFNFAKMAHHKISAMLRKQGVNHLAWLSTSELAEWSRDQRLTSTSRLFQLVEDFEPIEGEGWDVSNLPAEPTSMEQFLDAGIERLDEDAVFDGDDSAVAFVAERAAEGSRPHQIALEINACCDAIRTLIWGSEWVHSRIGPE